MTRDCGDETRRPTIDADSDTKSSRNSSEGCKITSPSASSTLNYESGRCTRGPVLDDANKRANQRREQGASCAKKSRRNPMPRRGKGVHTDLIGLANGERDRNVQMIL